MDQRHIATMSIGPRSRKVLSAALACAIGAAACNAQTTIAHYRFETGAPGAVVAVPVVDTQGLHPFMPEPGTNAAFSAVVPVGTVPQTCEANLVGVSFGTTASLRSTDAELTMFAFDEWTIETFVRFKGIGGFQTFLGKDAPQAGADVYFQRSNRTNTIYFSMRDSSGTARGSEAGPQVQAQRWYHVAAVKTESTLRLYVDGQMQWEVAAPLPLIRRNSAWTIGRGWWTGPTDASNAIVDEVRFSSAALGPAQFLRAAGPSIDQSPASATACPSGNATLWVTGAGSGPFEFQWQYESAPNTWIDAADAPIPYTHGTITASGVDTNQLHLALSTTHGAPPLRFRCVVTTSCGSIASDPATLAPCQADFTCDGQVDDADFVGFAASYNVLDCADPAMTSTCPADLNGDGFVDDSDFVLFAAAYNELGCL